MIQTPRSIITSKDIDRLDPDRNVFNQGKSKNITTDDAKENTNDKTHPKKTSPFKV
ncbi:hypothetical protein TUM3811_28220 [Shewanella algae]|nr:hypothetical protein TUM3811_28220 [Shewanella algae]